VIIEGLGEAKEFIIDVRSMMGHVWDDEVYVQNAKIDRAITKLKEQDEEINNLNVIASNLLEEN